MSTPPSPGDPKNGETTLEALAEYLPGGLNAAIAAIVEDHIPLVAIEFDCDNYPLTVLVATPRVLISVEPTYDGDGRAKPFGNKVSYLPWRGIKVIGVYDESVSIVVPDRRRSLSVHCDTADEAGALAAKFVAYLPMSS